ncbi:MAG: YjgP/YjgQ family permease [Bacteroidetes bacterium]|nr:MAG: YjgP/YjgQ family permease [Bacteroidota bacterium]
MKKVDKLLLTSFIGPFIVSFGIALFVLVMQFLWLYIDEIAGKGVSVFILLELIGYLSISTFPMALPIAVLIASVMVLGNLAERYELSSLKSAGISLMRIMRSLIVIAAGIALFSYVCSDFLIPVANLKFKSRLYDIRKQKPALTLEKEVFNEDFQQFVIRIGDKARDGETIKDVLIEDQTNSGKLRFNQILADSGQMFTTRDKRFFVMNLFDGAQYQEPATQSSSGGERYPFIRTNFKSWTKVWALEEFEMSRTDEDRFKNQRSMLSMTQLRRNMDSLNMEVDTNRYRLVVDLMANIERTYNSRFLNVEMDTTGQGADSAGLATTPGKQLVREARRRQTSGTTIRPDQVYTQKIDKPLTDYSSILETFVPEDQERLLRGAIGQSRSGQIALDRRMDQIVSRRKEAIKTGYELYTKYSFAIVCLIFLFIGAPMGAIIRKGGFGYPILVSIIFFVTFIMLTIMCRKLAEAYILTPFWAAMAPSVTLIPIGTFLTRRAMNDSQMFSTDRLDRFMMKMRKRFQKNEPAV